MENKMEVPFGIKLLGLLPLPIKLSPTNRLFIYRSTVLVLTFFAYVFFTVARKSISVVKTKLISCNSSISDTEHQSSDCSSWIDEMDGQTESVAKHLEGVLDSAFLFSYAFFKFGSGFVAEHMNLRYFLTLGMFLSGTFSILFGLAFYVNIHSFTYFVIMQIFAGAFQSSGWPGVITFLGHWFHKGQKGFVMGVWSSNNAVGNILGSIIAGVWVEDSWGMSFIVPGTMLAAFSFVIWFLLVTKPEHVGLSISDNDKETEMSKASKEDASKHNEEPSVGFLGALKIPGVLEFSLCFFFAKLIIYTFLYWLPTFIKEKGEGRVTSEDAAYLSTMFDIGGIVGGMVAGFITDRTGRPAMTCVSMLAAAIPVLFAYNEFGDSCPVSSEVKDNCYWGNVGLLFIGGLFVYGPYALINTAVSAELGTHPSLQGSSKSLFLVTAIIDGTGSVGASIGPLITGAIEGMENGLTWTFVMLLCANVCSILFLSRLFYKEIRRSSERQRQNTI